MRKTTLAIVFILIVFPLILLLSEIIGTGFGLWSQFNRNIETTFFIQKYRPELIQILTDGFDSASSCQTKTCRDTISLQIFNSLETIEELVLYPALVFVRAMDNNQIEIMTLSANYYRVSFDDPIVHHRGTTNIKNLSKKRKNLYDVLSGKIPNVLIQYGYKEHSSNTTMRYLGYMHSEAEIIHVVRDFEGEIVGGIVRFHGD